MRRRLATLGLLCAALVLSGPVSAQEAARRAYDLSSELMSPFCPGRTLQDCPSPDAGAVREQIRGWVDAGVSDAEIRARVEASFGDRVVGIPRSAWGRAGPVVILVIGLGLLALAIRRAVRMPTTPEEPLDAELEASLLAQLDRQDPEI